MKRVTGAALLASVFACAACSSTEEPAPEPREPAPAYRHASFASTLEREAETFGFANGDWQEDLGDAAFYGLAHYARSRTMPERTQAARQHALSLITNADFFEGDLQEIVMSAFGLIEYAAVTGDKADLPAIDAFVDRLDRLVALIGWYIDTAQNQAQDKSWALRAYGPTSISALVGLVNAQYALLLGTDKKQERVEWAVQMETKISERAWNGTYYAFGAKREGLVDYPNVAMLLFEARLFQLTRDERHRARAVALYDALQPLKLAPTEGDGPVRYYSAYSAADMGATTRDYSTLSSHNYLMLALMVLYEITGKARYVAEADRIADAVSTQLHGEWCLSHVHDAPCTPACAAQQACVAGACTADRCQGGVLHHWIDGRLARPSDPEVFCSGCNLQLLYVLSYREQLSAR